MYPQEADREHNRNNIYVEFQSSRKHIEQDLDLKHWARIQTYFG